MCQQGEGAEGELHKTTNYVIPHPPLLVCTVHGNYSYLKHCTKSNADPGGILMFSGILCSNVTLSLTVIVLNFCCF